MSHLGQKMFLFFASSLLLSSNLFGQPRSEDSHGGDPDTTAHNDNHSFYLEHMPELIVQNVLDLTAAREPNYPLNQLTEFFAERFENNSVLILGQGYHPQAKTYAVDIVKDLKSAGTDVLLLDTFGTDFSKNLDQYERGLTYAEIREFGVFNDFSSLDSLAREKERRFIQQFVSDVIKNNGPTDILRQREFYDQPLSDLIDYRSSNSDLELSQMPPEIQMAMLYLWRGLERGLVPFRTTTVEDLIQLYHHASDFNIRPEGLEQIYSSLAVNANLEDDLVSLCKLYHYAKEAGLEVHFIGEFDEDSEAYKKQLADKPESVRFFDLRNQILADEIMKSGFTSSQGGGQFTLELDKNVAVLTTRRRTAKGNNPRAVIYDYDDNANQYSVFTSFGLSYYLSKIGIKAEAYDVARYSTPGNVGVYIRDQENYADGEIVLPFDIAQAYLSENSLLKPKDHVPQ